MLTKEEAVKLLNDIDEIQDVFCRVRAGYPLDRKKAEDIIRKHNLTDPLVAAYNSPIIPGYVTFEQATDQMVLGNLNTIQIYLSAKLTGKSIDELMR